MSSFVRFGLCAVSSLALLALMLGCQPPKEKTANAPPASQGAPPAVAEDAAPPATAAEKVEPKNADANSAEPIPELLTAAELDEGWISLFDGQTLFGWKANSDANWRVEDGAIVVDSGTPGLLCTTAQFADYALKCEFKAPRETNSGIFLHTPVKPTDPASDCYELNIAPQENPFPTASFVKRAKADGDFSSDDWQTFEVTVLEGKLTVAVNGKPAVEYTDPSPLRRGHIGLQLNQGKVAFRNIKLKPLEATSLFNGRDLTGWKQYPDMASKFTVTSEGWINVKDGRGQLESEKSYGDFTLQLECISHAQNLNSGIFFRCIPGETMNGYECQIHNGFKNGDRTQPMDCGTGGIFRRQNARRIVANDLEWFHLTLVANGNHMAAWVNGYQVSDWTDEREPNPNPRNGRRDEPGTLMIQGHDPTTDLSFRDLSIREHAPRRP